MTKSGRNLPWMLKKAHLSVFSGHRLRTFFGILLENFEREAPVELHAGSAEQGPNGAGGAPLLSNHLAEIAGGHAQLQDGDLFALNFADSDLLREVHKSFRDLFDEFSQSF